MSYTTIRASDQETGKYLIYRAGELIGLVGEARYNATNPEENGLLLLNNVNGEYVLGDVDHTPFTLKERPVDDYTDQNLITVFTNEV